MPFDSQKLTDLLRCPRSQSRLMFVGGAFVCTDPDCRLRFEIHDEIPNLIPEDATVLPVKEWEDLVQHHGRVGSAEQ